MGCIEQRGDMDDRIRVDTDELKTKSKALETSAGVFAQAGKDILAYAASLPSYDGQLSTPARAAALEINRQCQDVHSSYMSDSQSLARTAQAFADVDNQTVDVFGENTALLSESPLYGGPGGEVAPNKRGGNYNFLGYEDYGDYVILWKNGEPHTIIVTDENRAMVEKYEKDVDDYCKNLADFLATLRDLMLQGMGIAQIALLICVLVALGFISMEIVGFLILSLGISAELLGSAMDNAKDLVAHFFGEYGDDLAEKLGSLFNPADPNKYVNDIKNLMQYGQAATQAYDDAQSDWNALVPTPTPSGPTAVPAETPPTPNQTPTPPAP
jgi:hypothetical protein